MRAPGLSGETMPNTVLIIHGASNLARDNIARKWPPVIKSVTGVDTNVLVPGMPAPESPDLSAWLDFLTKRVSAVQGPLHLVGHSFGGTVVLKFLADSNAPVRKAHIAAAPFWCGRDPAWNVSPFALSPEELDVLKQRELSFYHGTADDIVPCSHLDEFRAALPGARFRSYAGMNHIDPSENFLRDLSTDFGA